ncbi:MAG: NADH-quinone oxidoreductase subunit, partial [Cryptosporangiaceae bacterium]|nr:NADH-quinone oxidoreductase subunit [Cryptosporangiaceae bacterium]
VPKGTLIIRAAEQLGIQIPRFCDHPLLEPVGACRQCIVEVEGQRKPLASCTSTVTPGMIVKTQLSSPVAEKAQRGTLELLLINHPLDCPVCDKGGECPLQNQAMSNGPAESRFREVKRTYPKPLRISSQVLLDRERCVLCARCTRFSQQIAGDPFIELFERGALEQVSIYEDQPFQSYFSGNTVQICPVGALTGAAYRFRARPFDLVSTPSACEHCASGCAMRTDWRRGTVLRRLAGDDPLVNEEWNCDKGRWAFTYARAIDRLTYPLIRNAAGELERTSWTEAIERAAEGLREAADRGGVGVLAGGRVSAEDAYAYSKFARVALGTNHVDFRARPHSAEEAEFLAAYVAGVTPETGGVTYADLEAAPTVLLAGFEPEEESPIVFLRLRKAFRKSGLRVYSVAPLVSAGLAKLGGTLIQAVPGAEPKVLDALTGGGPRGELADVAEALGAPGAVILVGERLGSIPGALSAAVRLADISGARIAWIPRRAGERGAIEAGLLPGLLPGGRPVTDASGRAELERAWGLAEGELPSEPGLDTDGIIAAAASGSLAALVVGGVDPGDLSDPAAAEAALASVGFVVSLEVRASAVTEHADVVLPVAPPVEKAGTYLDWEGRPRSFEITLQGTGALPDAKVLGAIADEMGLTVGLGVHDVTRIRTEIGALATTTAARRPVFSSHPIAERPVPGPGEAVLSTWRHLLDLGSLQDNEEHLAGTARTAYAHVSAPTAAEVGVAPGDLISVSTDRGTVTVPVAITDMPDRVVWLPANSTGSTVRRTLAADAGSLVRLAPATTAGGL